MAVYLSMNFNDSYSMTDYFCPHAQIGNDMLLGIVNKQAQKESVARHILSRYPELNKLSWEWNTENYSMGHGNYLESEYNGHTEKHKAYDGREEVNTHYEISFDSYSKSMLPYREYPGDPVEVESVASNDVNISYNEQHNGIEVRFPEKPSVDILDSLKSLGFRWSKFQKIWYARFSDSLMAEVSTLLKS